MGIKRSFKEQRSIYEFACKNNFFNLFYFKMLNTEEWVDGVNKGTLGEVLVRCNNVLYIR